MKRQSGLLIKTAKRSNIAPVKMVASSKIPILFLANKLNCSSRKISTATVTKVKFLIIFNLLLIFISFKRKERNTSWMKPTGHSQLQVKVPRIRPIAITLSKTI